MTEFMVSSEDRALAGGVGEPATLEEAMALIYAEMLRIMLEKRALRGTENITRQGAYGVATRMAEDKLARIQRAVNRIKLAELLQEVCRMTPEAAAALVPGMPKGGDSLRDDLIDTANYAIICLLLLEGRWELPMESEMRGRG